jgi:hypothetical protein
MNFNREVLTFLGEPLPSSSGLFYPNDEGSTFLQNAKFSVYSSHDKKILFYVFIQLTAVNVLHNGNIKMKAQKMKRIRRCACRQASR